VSYRGFLRSPVFDTRIPDRGKSVLNRFIFYHVKTTRIASNFFIYFHFK